MANLYNYSMEPSRTDAGILEEIWNGFDIQLTPINKTVSISGPLMALMDEAARDICKIRAIQKTNLEDMTYFRDGSHFGRYMLASHAAIVAMPGAEILHTGELFPILVIRDSVEAAKVEEVVKPARTARPPNAWILYRKDHHKGVKAEFPEMHNNDISIHISGMWHNESFEVRKRYKEMAEAHRERFHKEHPGYKYKPRKSSEVIRRAKRAVTGSIAEGRVVKVGRLTPAVQMHLETQELKAAEGVRPAFIALGTPRVPTAVEVEEQTAAEHEADEAEVAAEIAFVDEMEF